MPSSLHLLVAIDWALATAAERAVCAAIADRYESLPSSADTGTLTIAMVDPHLDGVPPAVTQRAVSLEHREVAEAADLILPLGPVHQDLLALAVRTAERGRPVAVQNGSTWRSEPAISAVQVVYAEVSELFAPRGIAVAPPPRAAAQAPLASVQVGTEHPSVTVVIPTYNRATYLGLAIDSVLAQSYPHVRVVVADDGSTDDTAAVVKGRDDPRVRLFSKEHTNGPDTRNRVLATIDSPWVLWLGDDDLLTPRCVASRVAVHQAHPDADVVYGDLTIVDDQLRPSGRPFVNPDWYHRSGELLAALFERNRMTDGGSLIRFDCFRRVNGYDPAFPKAHDYEFWTRLAPHAVFKKDDTAGYLWRWHGSNMGLGSGVNPYQDAHIRITLGLVARHEPRELFPSIPWDKLDARSAEGIASLMIAIRLGQEGAIAFALTFARTAAKQWPTPQANDVLTKLETLAAAQETPALAMA